MSRTERQPPIPGARADINDEWMSRALGVDVAIVEEQRVGTGQVGMCVRYRLEGSEDAPARVVAKFPSDDDVSRATGMAMRNYEREVRFYKEIAPTVGIRTPRCYHADWDRDSGLFVLLLEDLAPAQQGDQLEGCTLDEAALALEELAKLHAPRWADPTLVDIAWLRDRDADGVASLISYYRTFWPGFLDIYSGVMTPSQIALGERFGASIEPWVSGDHAPRTVIHGDYRLDNMLFGTEEGGYPLAVVDWQTPGRGAALSDASYFLGAGLLPDERRAHEVDLLRRYHEQLHAGGVRDFSWDACWEDYRRWTFAGCVMSVIASMVVGSSERGIAMFSAMTERHFTHAEDLDAAEFLR